MNMALHYEACSSHLEKAETGTITLLPSRRVGNSPRRADSYVALLPNPKISATSSIERTVRVSQPVIERVECFMSMPPYRRWPFPRVLAHCWGLIMSTNVDYHAGTTLSTYVD